MLILEGEKMSTVKQIRAHTFSIKPNVVLTPTDWYEKMVELHLKANTIREGIDDKDGRVFGPEGMKTKNVEINENGISTKNRYPGAWWYVSDMTPQHKMTFDLKTLTYYTNSTDRREFKEYKENDAIDDPEVMKEILKVFRAAGYDAQLNKGMTMQSRMKAGMFFN